MDHRATSLKFLRQTGLIPVKVRPGQKDPFPEWDPRRVELDDHKLTLKVLENDPKLNLGALFAGKYVDIDVDTTNPFVLDALDYFLPQTPWIWGRKSKPRSHRAYALHDDFDRGPKSSMLRYIKDLSGDKIDGSSYSIEVRGGKIQNGLFTVLPGSYRSDVDETVEWADDIDPTVGGAYIDIDRLLRSIRMALSAAIVAPHWNEGVRNDMSMALAGTLWRIRTSTRAAYMMDKDDDPPEGAYVLDETDAKAIFDCIMKLAGDDEADRRSRLLNLTNTWRKLDSETTQKVTGGKVLGELIGEPVGPKVVKGLYRLLSDNDAAEQIEKLAEQYVMWYGVGVLIDLEMIKNSRDIPYMNKMAADHSFAGTNITVGGEKIPKSRMLFGTNIVARVQGLTFDPSQSDMVVQTPQGLFVNQWRGFATEPCPQRVTPPEVEMFTNYVRVIIADGDEEKYNWVIAWMADLLQHPADKSGTALVLVGPQGAGKTFLGSEILGPIIGRSHFTSLNSVSALTDNFNTIIDNKLLIQCEEAVHSYQREAANRLKDIITGKYIHIEPKGVNKYEKPNHMRLLFTSNEEDAAIFIDPSPHERRFTVLKVSTKHVKDPTFWVPMHTWIRGLGLPKVMRFLLDHKYDRALIRRPIDTEAKRNLQRIGVNVEVSWIVSRLAQGFPIGDREHQHWFEAFHTEHLTDTDQRNNVLRRDFWPNKVLASKIESDFRSYVRSMGKMQYSGSIITSIRRVLPDGSFKVSEQRSVRYLDHKTGQATNARVRLASWPDEDSILEHLKAKFGPVVERMFDEIKNLPEIGAPKGEPVEEREF